MTYPIDGRLEIRSWALSTTLHVVIVGSSLLFVAQIQPPKLKEPFTWDVSLVMEEVTEAAATPAEPARLQRAAPAQMAVKQVEPVPQVATRQAQTTERPMVVPREQQQVVEQTQVVGENRQVVQREETKHEQSQARHPEIEQRQLIAERHEPSQRRVEEIQERAVHDSPVREGTQSEVAQHEMVTMPAQTVATQAAAVSTQQASQMAVVQHEMRETAATQSLAEPIQRDAVTATETALSSEAVPSKYEKTIVTAVAPESASSDAPLQVAKVAPSASQVKADHRWLAESLWRRVAELKRYPASARLNGLEGKVVLKAIIRSDGHLAEVSVQKSSGHTVLDEAAMEAVRLACPLHMRHELGKPQIVVSLPIVYSLAN